MSYDIRAWLDRDGKPQLQIIDIESGDVRVDWSFDEHRTVAVKALFRQLMLLSVREKLNASRPWNSAYARRCNTTICRENSPFNRRDDPHMT